MGAAAIKWLNFSIDSDPQLQATASPPGWQSGYFLHLRHSLFACFKTMSNQMPFTCSTTVAPSFLAFDGLRLRARCFGGQILRELRVFLASSLSRKRLTSSLFHSSAPLQARPFHTVWCNPAVKLTSQRRADYFVR